jgi:hypothetical protein
MLHMTASAPLNITPPGGWDAADEPAGINRVSLILSTFAANRRGAIKALCRAGVSRSDAIALLNAEVRS